jgi:hypothetical protein
LDGDRLEGVSGTPTLAEFLLETDTDGFLVLPEGRPLDLQSHATITWPSGSSLASRVIASTMISRSKARDDFEFTGSAVCCNPLHVVWKGDELRDGPDP